MHPVRAFTIRTSPAPSCPHRTREPPPSADYDAATQTAYQTKATDRSRSPSVGYFSPCTLADFLIPSGHVPKMETAMPTLRKTEYEGEVTCLRSDAATDSLRSQACTTMDLATVCPAPGTAKPTFLCAGQGAVRRRHRNPQRPPVDHPVRRRTRHDRQGYGLKQLDPCLGGVNIVLSGTDFTHVPPNSRLQGPSGATLTIDMENLPCVYPAREIETDAPGHGEGSRLPIAAEVSRLGRTARQTESRGQTTPVHPRPTGLGPLIQNAKSLQKSRFAGT